jgi:hypothetical protein
MDYDVDGAVVRFDLVYKLFYVARVRRKVEPLAGQLGLLVLAAEL